MFIRQIGALFFPAALLALFLARKKQRVRPLMRITFFFAALAAVGYVWLGFAGFLPETAGVHLLDNVTGMLTHAAWWWVYGVLYLGLFILPLFAAIALRRRRKFLGTTAIAWFIMAGIGVAAIWLLRGQYFPYVSNIINHQGLGPSGEVLQGVETAMFPLWIWWGVTALAAIGTAWFLQFYARRKWKFLRRRDSMSTSTFFIFASLGFQFLFVMLVSSFDRYWLPSLALALALVGMYYGENFKQRRVVLIVAVLAMGLYSVVGTQNYMRWNEVRWSEAETLVSQGVAAQQIEAGYEWCGWKLQEQSVGIENPHDRSKPWYVNSICPVNTAEYVISFSELEGREIIKKASYKSLYDTSPFLYVLKKDSP